MSMRVPHKNLFFCLDYGLLIAHPKQVLWAWFGYARICCHKMNDEF